MTACNPTQRGWRTRFRPAPLGGTFLVEGSVEARFPVWRELVGAVFVDGGLVQGGALWRFPPAGPHNPRIRARYKSPVGPIRADIGFNPGTTESLPVIPKTSSMVRTSLVTLQIHESIHRAAASSAAWSCILSIGEAF